MAVTLVHDCDVQRRVTPAAVGGDFRDGHMSSSSPTNNYGVGNQFQPGIYDSKSLFENRALLYFDLNAFIPASATIIQGDWRLYVHSTNAGNQAFRAVRCRRHDWVEDQATWNIYKTGSNWGTAGASNTTSDRDTGVTDSLGGFPSAGWYSVTLTNIVPDAWTNQNGICTFIFERVNPASEGQIMCNAKEMHTTDPITPHHLRITYTLDGRTYQALIH